MFDSIKRLIKKWRASRDGGHQLDALLAIAERSAPYPERSEWLIELAHWIRRGRAELPEQRQQDVGRRRALRLRQRRVPRGDRPIVETGLRPIAGDELRLRKVRQHDGAAQLRSHGLNLRGRLVANVDDGSTHDSRGSRRSRPRSAALH